LTNLDREQIAMEKDETDRDSYLRWQGLALTQLGYSINLMLTIAVAMLAFAATTMMQSKVPLPYPARWLFHCSLPTLAIAVFVAIAANVTRALDFRYSRRAARARMKGEGDHNDLQDTAEWWGKWTWRLFYVQATTFGIGVVALALGIWCGFGDKI
jgi:hypothetical protein